MAKLTKTLAKLLLKGFRIGVAYEKRTNPPHARLLRECSERQHRRPAHK
jgi:hypothetical protein